ncbi:MAG: bifunctional hydroxymethylpyrimidine kinase/phosphomethylpyrimidine kinase [Alphaproteobacteria bacterium]
MTRGRVLIVAGSDSGGGAGIQADIKTVTALGGYAATAIAALTAQNTMGVFGILDVPPEFVARQMTLVLDDIGADAIKTGMLHRAEVIGAVCDEIEARATGIPVVVDPVMVAKGGQALLQDAAQQALRDRLLPLAAVLTPNVPEAEALTGRAISTDADVEAVARALLAMGSKAILLKGGHRPGSVVRDLLVTRDGMDMFEAPRIETKHTHGTGCTLASAIATGLAQGRSLKEAVARAHAYVQAAIRAAPGLGHGRGPLGHDHTIRPFEPPA